MKRITVSHLNKKFTINHTYSKSVLAELINFIFRSLGVNRKNELKKSNKITVADDISFEAAQGECVGIIGRNGSGKSTLLRIIAEIYRPDSGEVTVNGSLIYLSGFGQGLQPLLTMRENIYILAAIMGLSQIEIKNRFKEIVEFSGLENFIETKLYQFSSGMSARLNFSVTIFCLGHRKPDILLLDEVLNGAGDIDFQNKAIVKMEECIRGGSTVLLVSHDLHIIEKYCHRVIWLDKGSIVKIGKPKKVVAEYVAASKQA